MNSEKYVLSRFPFVRTFFYPVYVYIIVAPFTSLSSLVLDFFIVLLLDLSC